MKNIIYSALFALIVLVSAACSKIEEADQIYISYSSYTFGCEPGNLVLDINSNAAWDVSCDADWIELGGKSDDKLEISVTENATSSVRHASLTFTAGTAVKSVSISQLYKTFSGTFADIDELFTPVFSRNGKFYATVTIVQGDDGSELKAPLVVNCETGERQVLEGLPGYTSVRAVSDDGSIVAYSSGLGGDVLYVDGEAVDVPVPGCQYYAVHAISSDNRIMAGYAYNAQERSFKPVRWIDRVPEILLVPEKDLADYPVKNAMARGCSADGSVIYGSDWNTYGLMYWKDGEVHYPAKDLMQIKTINYDNYGTIVEMPAVSYIFQYAESHKISANGRYIAAGVLDYLTESPDRPSEQIRYPVVLDTETGEAHYLQFDGMYDHIGLTADNDGVCYAAAGHDNYMTGFVFDFNSSRAYTISEWMSSRYGISVDDNRMVVNVSDDGNVISGWKANSSMIGILYSGWYYMK